RIGVIIFIKQIPHASGSDLEIGSGLGIFSSVYAAFQDIQPGILIITVASLAVLIAWQKIPALKKLKLVPGALIAVVLGVVINELFILSGSPLAVSSNYLVSLPVPSSLEELQEVF